MASRLQDVILRGLAASRPAATAVAAGTLYFSTDTQVLERSTGSAWESYSVIVTATGDVVGPGSAVDQAIVLFNGTTGKLLADSTTLLSTLAPKASPALTGVPTVPTAAVGTNTTQAASTAFVIANAGTPSAHHTSHESGGSDVVTLAESQVTNLVTDLAAKAPLAAPTFTGVATFTGQFGPALYNAGNSGSALTINFNNGNDQYITLTGNAAITFSNSVSGFRYALVFNTGAGGFTPTFPGTVSWLDAVPTLPTTASKLYVVVLLYLGNVTKYLASFSKEP